MIEISIVPRFTDTDALGHISNCAYATWFEEGRREIFSYFVPNLDPKDWNLIIARTEFDFLAQAYYQREVTIRSGIEKLGNSSLTIQHEAFQQGKKVAQGKAIMVHFDYQAGKPAPIPETARQKLSAHLIN
jgi:acyl-CoA thioester hydrolase